MIKRFLKLFRRKKKQVFLLKVYDSVNKWYYVRKIPALKYSILDYGKIDYEEFIGYSDSSDPVFFKRLDLRYYDPKYFPARIP